MPHNIYTFNALFDVLAAAAEARTLGVGARHVSINDVEEMTERMKDAGVQADTVSLNSALSVLVALARSTLFVCVCVCVCVCMCMCVCVCVCVCVCIGSL